ncbi:protein-disulfide reductase DsbD [Ningiella sp. W23]|uniref:protein-disulfide reductase DsbD n=1 Tax=Ningiella sp. W23 TaxID=3023715 RepID=UPI00375716A6
MLYSKSFAQALFEKFTIAKRVLTQFSILGAFSALLLSLTSLSLHAQQTPASLFSDSPSFLKVDEAFGFDFEQRDGELIIKWDIAEGYYLYKKQFQANTKNAVLGEAVYPEHETIEDEFFGVSDVFFNDIEISYPIVQTAQDGQVRLRFQGCAEAGLCYPPTTKVIYLDAYNAQGSADVSSTANQSGDTNDVSSGVSQQFTLAERLLSDESLAVSLGILLLLGIGLAFTPCVYPMYPILSTIVIGRSGNNAGGEGAKAIKLSHAFILSFVYVQGMAITYSLLGLIVASAGVQFQAALQNPILLGIFIILFIALAFAMFGAYEIQLPSKWQEKLNSLSNEQKSGNLIGVFVMGVISGLVASPCTTAPLTAVLLVVAQSDSLLFGFSALYALSLGMGIPLILFGMTGGKLLPKAGNWMNVIKVTFGFMMLTVAILFVERIFVAPWTEFLWVVLGLSLFAYLITVNQDTKTGFGKGLRNLVVITGFIASVLYGVHALQLNGLLGNNTLLAGTSSQSKAAHPEFIMVRDLDDFDIKLAAANAEGKSVMVDLYADWCVACKEFEKYTFPDPAVVEALKDTVWMQIDLTVNTPANLAFQEEFGVLGLPTILFFDAQGNELSQSRVTGFMKAEAFATHVNSALQN